MQPAADYWTIIDVKMTSNVQPAADYWTNDRENLGTRLCYLTKSEMETIAHLLNDKDSENTKKSTKQHRLIFESYLKEKNIRNPTTAVELAAVLRKFKKKEFENILNE